MFFASRLQNIRVMDSAGELSGYIKDLIATFSKKYPRITSILVKRMFAPDVLVSWNQIRSFEESEVFLSCKKDEIEHIELREDEVLIIKDVLDKQIVDTEGKKLIRVQDIKLARIGSGIRVVAVDISSTSVLRRLGLGFLADWIAIRIKPNLIDWANVELIGSNVHNVKLKVAHEKLKLLHPADIADLVNEMAPGQRTAVLSSLDSEVAADALGEMEDSYQANVISDMESEKASDILEEMDPDEAADLIADLPEEKAEELLDLMEEEEAREIRQLLQYPEDTAGGIMTTEYFAINDNLAVSEALDLIRKHKPEAESIYYVYVVDDSNRLRGVISLVDLVTGSPEVRISAIMNENVVKVGLTTKHYEVAKVVAKYNLLAVPVVDENNTLMGIVTVDDAIDIVIPTAYKKRIPRIYS